jgi:hypothetical protein
MTLTSTAPWLRSPEFDVFFLAGIPLIAILSAVAVIANHDLFVPILFADLWLLGYHHVISTFTRLAFDRDSFREHHRLIIYLLPAVALAVGILGATAGLWAIATTYLYWQWWHYTRQSEGISKAYAGKSREFDLGNPVLRRAAFYSVPVACIMAVSHKAPTTFLFMPIRTLPLMPEIALLSYALAILLVSAWLVEQYRVWRRGRLASTFFVYVLSHFAVYITAYIAIDNLDHGWLAINIWHNAQYIFFVWLFNNRRFNGGTSETHRFLSTISQDGRLPLYLATCFAVTTLVYYVGVDFLVDTLNRSFAVSAAMASIIVYQTINFHHYIVDSLIWKLRKPKMQRTLGLG